MTAKPRICKAAPKDADGIPRDVELDGLPDTLGALCDESGNNIAAEWARVTCPKCKKRKANR